MPKPNQAALDFLLTRRSRPHKTLTYPAPDRDTLVTLLTAAARTPDHGKLEPWRFIVLQDSALPRLAALSRTRGAELGYDADSIEKIAAMFENAPLSVAVVASPQPSEKIPEIEQTLSAGAVCLALLNAALAAGWGANWLTGWTAFDRTFLSEGLGIEPPEYVAGFIHLGTETSTPPDRPRPDLDAKTTWLTA
ncbi:nitroreductase family protein [Litoreibacter arenae]|uniref:Putative NAD(P)H nitroreductase n=1 Tax=Litoreibacter arenae DSM 19593 TaxID=1123360 RepID=S9S5P0_9RHOB|nr:nitroreductase [Litoreibacter arenae]EPX81514.1 Nitroreductase family protein [Litoreibacter arenae DSM 19593]